MDNPTVNLPNLNSLLCYSIDKTLFACSRIPTIYSTSSWSTSMTGFCAAKAFKINLNVLYPPVSGFEDPFFFLFLKDMRYLIQV